MSRDIAHLLPQRAAILRVQRTGNGHGGYVENLVPLARNVPCRVGSASLNRFSDIDGRLATDPTRAAYFRPGQDLQPHDRIEVAGQRMVVQAIERQADGVYLKAFLSDELVPLP